MIARAIVVLPHPDSPASASTSPSCSVSVAPSTARAMSGFFAPDPGPQADAGLELDLQIADLDDRPSEVGGRRRRYDLRAHVAASAAAGMGPVHEQAGRASARAGVVELGIDRSAVLEHRRAPRVERAARGDGLRVGRVAPEARRLAPEAVVADLGERGRECRRVGVLRVVEDVLGRALLDDPAGVHHREPVRDLHQHRQVVGDEDHRQTEVALELLHQPQDLRLHHHVERRRGLVGDDQRWVAGQRHRDHHTLLLAAGQLVRVVVAAARREPDLLEQRARPSPSLRARPPGRGRRSPRRSGRPPSARGSASAAPPGR